MAEVHIRDGETLESELRRFKRKVQEDDIIKEIKRHLFYLKPGQKKRIKSALARKRNHKKRRYDSVIASGNSPNQHRDRNESPRRDEMGNSQQDRSQDGLCSPRSSFQDASWSGSRSRNLLKYAFNESVQ